MADEKGNLDHVESPEAQNPEESTAEREKRIRTLTEKGKELYETHCVRFVNELEKCKDQLSNELMTIAIVKSNPKEIREAIQRLEIGCAKYELTHKNYVALLEGYSTEQSLRQKNIQVSEYQEVNMKTQSALEAAKKHLTLIDKDKESQKTSSSKRSAIKLKLAEETARLKLIEAQLAEEEKKASIERRRAELSTMFELNRTKQEVAEEESDDDLNSQEDDRLKDIPKLSGVEKTRNFIENANFKSLQTETSFMKNEKMPPQVFSQQTPDVHVDQLRQRQHTLSHFPSYPVSAPAPSAAHYPNQLSEFHNFLLKKDITMNRFMKFDDNPTNYSVWKASFKNIVESLILTPQEETDLLVKWLGPDSSRQALSLRAANIHNPIVGLQRIWARLDERYGAPELIESSIRKKLASFQRIQLPRDARHMYDLVDILSEIQCLKEDSNYAALLSFYDTSSGVNPIIAKLPQFLQNKWMDRAARYKKSRSVTFPPFTVFIDFVSEMASTLNDPCFMFDYRKVNEEPKPVQKQRQCYVTTKKTGVKQDERSEYKQKILCPIHPKSRTHELKDCKEFFKRSFDEKKGLLKEHRACFRCCSLEHLRTDCKTSLKCSECNSTSHMTAMHMSKTPLGTEPVTQTKTERVDGGEHLDVIPISSKCTAICGKSFKGRSCAKTLAVNIYKTGNPERSTKVYAMLDEHCNRSLISPEVLDTLGIHTAETQYTLTSCSGSYQTAGRIAHNLTIQSLDKDYNLELPTVIECPEIPNDVTEIPTPDVAQHFPHLQGIANMIPPYDPDVPIGLLIGRDVTEAHHVLDQIIGPKDTPFAQRLHHGWVIIGEACLERTRTPFMVNSKKTSVRRDGRPSLFEPCSKGISVKRLDTNKPPDKDQRVASSYSGDNLFRKEDDDNEVGLSVEDRHFLEIMDKEMVRGGDGNWTAPLPFRPHAPLPNNKELAERRAYILDKSLQKNITKRKHFVEFMSKVLESAAEVAPELTKDKEAWYLPLFGVYHPKKPEKIRGVFDSSAEFNGMSLNKILTTGPNLTNNLQGILIRFRKEKCAIVADIEQMFYSFLVREDHRDHLRFLWYKDNDADAPLIEYRMKAHAFGNSPSPAVATYGLRKCVQQTDVYGDDVAEFVTHNFYVDDGLTSLTSAEEAIDLLKRTQTALKTEGNLHLHKIASNDPVVMSAFPREDLCKEMVSLNTEKDTLPVHQSLGVSWDLHLDAFTFQIQLEEKPDTRRGCLSTLNSIYDPMGFVAPILLPGKILLREITKSSDWDETLEPGTAESWRMWKNSLSSLENVMVPRMYFKESLSHLDWVQLHVFSDASELAVSAVAYLRSCYKGEISVSFIMGKAKLAPSKGHTIPRLELCAALLATEVGEFIRKNLQTTLEEIRYHTDSKVVLGYLNNKTRRFFNYVSNRVERILSVTEPKQWVYVSTVDNPADHGTRGLRSVGDLQEKWLKGPSFLIHPELSATQEYSLVSPELDKEIRIEVKKTTCALDEDFADRCNRFSRWHKLVSVITLIKGRARRRFKRKGGNEPVRLREESEEVLIKIIQKQAYGDEIASLSTKSPVSKASPLCRLSPVLDEKGILRVGGRLSQSSLPVEQRNPIILPGKSHLTVLLVRHIHELVHHQGRLITEGALRNHGYWVTGSKRVVSSLLHKCIVCRKLRGNFEYQKMADLPTDRIEPGPPFTSVGVDTFGPWMVISRKTKGGMAHNKRWALLFTCLTTRAVHIEVVEDMTSSSVINAIRRLVAIRGEVREFRSDRGTNFVGAADEMKTNVVNIEDEPFKDHLDRHGITWIFNAPHSSHMGGVWERMIGMARRILDSMFLRQQREITHEVLVTLMAEVSAIINSRPITAISYDSNAPMILSPSLLLNQRTTGCPTLCEGLDIKDIYKAQWRHVQVLANTFWKQWKEQFLQSLQSRRKWTEERPNIKIGDVILLKDSSLPRFQWPVGTVESVYPSHNDNHVRKVQVRIVRDGKPVILTRPITELVLLIN